MATNSSDFSLAGIMQSASSVLSTLRDSTATLEALSREGTTVSEAMAKAVAAGTDANGDTALSLETRKLGELEAQQKKSEFYAAIGMDAQGQAKISNQLATAFKENVQRSLETAQSIRERESVGLLDNPLAWIVNQLILPDERNALDANMQEGNVIKASMNQLNNALQQTAQSEAAYAKTISAVSVDSQV